MKWKKLEKFQEPEEGKRDPWKRRGRAKKDKTYWLEA